jgi:hypothetical protein
MSCFSFYLLCFFFYKIGEQEGRTGSDQGSEGWHRWDGGGGRERGRRMNMVQKMNTQNCKCKMILVETFPGIRSGGMGESSGGGKSNVIYLIYGKNLCNEYYNVPTPSTTIKKKRRDYGLSFDMDILFL